MECWNSGIRGNWFAKGCHRFLNSIDKMNIAIKPLLRYFRTHYSIIPTFSPSRRGLWAGGQHSLRDARPCGLEANWDEAPGSCLQILDDSMSPPKSTPMIKQYLSIKDQYPDAILFYRMGDFYEMFFEDAHLASRALEITLTSRNKNDESPVPMCGVPHRAARSYIARLINKGYKVAVCDQIEDPAQAKGLVKRDVVRVITPGMIIEDELLDERSNNYVLAVKSKDGAIGIAFLDISTGTFRIAESKDPEAIIEEIRRISPREILLAESSKNDPELLPVTDVFTEISKSYLNDRAFEFKRSYERLTDQFKTVSLEGFGCENWKAGVCAAGAVVFYVRETQKQKLAHLTRIEAHRLDKYLMVDELSWQNLELSRNIRSGSRRATLIGCYRSYRHCHGSTPAGPMDALSPD